MERNVNPGATQLLSSLQIKQADRVLPKTDLALDCALEVKIATLSKSLRGTDVNSLETTKISEAISVLNQQQALIGGLQLAHSNAVKVAAALAEAVKLAQDGAIDVSDVFNHARQMLSIGNVKLSSVDDLFDQSPGEIIQGAATETKKEGQQTDVLTQTIRELRTAV